MLGVVVEEEHAPRVAAIGEGDRMGDRGVPPAEVVRVLRVGVLAVVDQQVGLPGEGVAGDPLRLEVIEDSEQRGLVVGQIAQRHPAVFYAEPQRRPAVVDSFGADARAADVPLAHRAVAKVELAGQLAHVDRSQGGGKIARDAHFQRHTRRRGPPDGHAIVRVEQGREEEQALNVVEVQVGEQDVDVLSAGAQVRWQVADPGAGVEYQVMSV